MLDDFLASLNLTLTTEFIPYSEAPLTWQRLIESVEKETGQQIRLPYDGEWLNLNWLCYLFSPTQPALATLYRLGLNNVRGYANITRLPSPTRQVAIERTVEQGVIISLEPTTQKVEPPSLLDILYDLTLDADIRHLTFEQWAAEYGYSTDSIKAEALYIYTRHITNQLFDMVGEPAITKLEELCIDY